MNATDAVRNHLWPSLFASHGVQVTYFRDGVQLGGTLDAVKGSGTIDIVSAEHTETAVLDDFVFQTSDLVAVGVWPPKRHDEIRWVDANAISHVYELNVDGVERQYDKVDQFGVLHRLHAVEVPA